MWTLLLAPIVGATFLFIAASLGWFGLDLDPKVRISDSLTVVSTTYLALVLQYIIARRTSSDRDELESVEEALSELSESLKILRVDVAACVGAELTEAQAGKVIFGFETCFDQLDFLALKLDMAGFTEQVPSTEALSDILIKQKAIVTGGNFPKKTLTLVDVQAISTARKAVARNSEQIKHDCRKAQNGIEPKWLRTYRKRLDSDFDQS